MKHNTYLRIDHPTLRYRCVAIRCGKFLSTAAIQRQGFWAYCRKHELANRAAQLAHSQVGH